MQYLLLFRCFNSFGQLVQVLTVFELNLCFPPENVLEFSNNARLNFQPVIQAFQLFVQLHTNICKEEDGEISSNNAVWSELQMDAKKLQ